jgi:hypothetical protein
VKGKGSDQGGIYKGRLRVFSRRWVVEDYQKQGKKRRTSVGDVGRHKTLCGEEYTGLEVENKRGSVKRSRDRSSENRIIRIS